jgi:putative flippase GtrA
MQGVQTSGAPQGRAATSRRVLVRRIFRYGTGSVVATVCSEVTFLLLYGVLDTSTTVASTLGWLAGAAPNYWLNRRWTWGRRGRPSLRRELLPYLAIVLVTLVLAVGATSLVSSWLSRGSASDAVRSALVGGTFLLVYVLVFLLRFFLFDRLFAAQPPQDAPSDEPDPPSDAPDPTPARRTT